MEAWGPGVAYALLQSRCDEDRNMTASGSTHGATGCCSTGASEPYIDSKVDQGADILVTSLKLGKPWSVRAHPDFKVWD